MQIYFNIALIILSLALITTILLQSRGSLGALFGGEAPGGQYKTRRGLEKTLFQVTIGLSIAFFILVVINVFLLRG
ncbi:MAG: hypothetical protein Kow00124_00380 [Anaerolineae bacterium]